MKQEPQQTPEFAGSAANASVVLVHGIWVGGWVMQPIARYLRAQGYTTHCFSYPSVRKSPQDNARDLEAFVNTLTTPVVHFVAHSLGGFILMHYYEQAQTIPSGRAVILGSPLCGSEKARRMSRWPILKQSLGRSLEGRVAEGIGVCCPEGRDIGIIAGSTPLGLGLLLGPFGKPNDGTVAVDETRVEGCRDHLVLPTSHTGMIMSQAVNQQIANFLRDGRFAHDAGAA